MGNTFASIHVLGADMEMVDCALANYQLESSRRFSADFDNNRINTDFLNENDSKQILAVLDLLKKYEMNEEEFFCLNQENFISIFSDFIVFENVDDVAKNYFENFNCIAIAVGLLDGDIFSVNIYKEGELIDGMVIGENLQEFGLTAREIKPDKVEKYFSLNPDEFNEILKLGDCELICEKFSSALNIKLDPKEVNFKNKSVEKFVY
ncbi:MAG: hypothetical protein IJ447_02495 [Clostridia bacterium]|nr:hypothetical protein [Clostridia bacterium]